MKKTVIIPADDTTTISLEAATAAKHQHHFVCSKTRYKSGLLYKDTSGQTYRYGWLWFSSSAAGLPELISEIYDSIQEAIKDKIKLGWTVTAYTTKKEAFADLVRTDEQS